MSCSRKRNRSSVSEGNGSNMGTYFEPFPTDEDMGKQVALQSDPVIRSGDYFIAKRVAFFHFFLVVEG